MSYRIVLTPTARRQLARLPDPVALAVYELLSGPLADNPQRVGKPLHRELADRWVARRGPYRVIHTINDDVVVVRLITHRRDAYRTR